MRRHARSGGLRTILEREDRGRASRGSCTGRIAGFLISTRRRYLSLLSGSRGRARARLRKHLPARLFLQGEQCIGREFPTGNSAASRAVRSSAQGRSSGRNQPQTCPMRAKGCLRRGIAPQPCAQEKRNSGPYCIQFLKRLVTASMVRKDSPMQTCGKAEECLIQQVSGASVLRRHG